MSQFYECWHLLIIPHSPGAAFVCSCHHIVCILSVLSSHCCSSPKCLSFSQILRFPTLRFVYWCSVDSDSSEQEWYGQAAVTLTLSSTSTKRTKVKWCQSPECVRCCECVDKLPLKLLLLSTNFSRVPNHTPWLVNWNVEHFNPVTTVLKLLVCLLLYFLVMACCAADFADGKDRQPAEADIRS